MRNMAFVTTILVCVVISSISFADTIIYKKVNKDGTITFSDQPLPGAIEIVIQQQASIIPSASVQNSALPTPTVKVKEKEYSLIVVSPENEATIRNNAGEFSIRAKLQPDLGGLYLLEINGTQYESPTGVFTLENMDRGEYQYKVSFADNSGKVIALSESRRLFLHRASVLSPAR